MDLTIGKARFEVRPARHLAGYRALRRDHPELLGLQARHVYFWDCALAPGGNPPRPDFHVIAPVLSFDMPDKRGALDPPAAVARARAFMQRAGLSDLSEIDRALLAAVAPVSVRIPWWMLDENMTAEFRVQVIAWNRYIPLRLTPADPPNHPEVLFGLPHSVRFEALATGRCGAAVPGVALPPVAQDSRVPEPSPDAAAERFREDCQRLDEARAGLPGFEPAAEPDPAEWEDIDARRRACHDALREGG